LGARDCAVSAEPDGLLSDVPDGVEDFWERASLTASEAARPSRVRIRLRRLAMGATLPPGGMGRLLQAHGGGAAPARAAVLVGLGVASLSMTARALPDVDAVLKSVTLAECQELARIALDAATAEDARSAVRAKLPILEELGL